MSFILKWLAKLEVAPKKPLIPNLLLFLLHFNNSHSFSLIAMNDKVILLKVKQIFLPAVQVIRAHGVVLCCLTVHQLENRIVICPSIHYLLSATSSSKRCCLPYSILRYALFAHIFLGMMLSSTHQCTVS